MGVSSVADVPLLTGKVVRFVDSHGYGFVSPDSGGEDVFVHAREISAVDGPVVCGTKVEFRVMDSGRGPKAYDVRVLDNGFRSAAPGPETSTATAFVASPEDMCEVLTEQEFMRAVTELILAADERITAGQTIAIRNSLCEFARANRWVD
jgi:cold shock protein